MIFDLFTTPPTVTQTTLGENLSGRTIVKSTTEDSLLNRIWDALPLGTLIKKVPSASEAAKGVAVGAAEAGKGIGSAAAAAGQAAVGGIEKAVIIVVVLLLGYLLLPSLIAGAARR